MIKNVGKVSIQKRMLTFILVLVMVLALLPMDMLTLRASADNSIAVGAPGNTLQVNFMSDQHNMATYASPILGSNVTIRFIPIVFENGDESVAWCLDHGKQLGTGTWTYDDAWSSTAVDPFIAWYFYHVYVVADWNEWQEQVISGFIQAVLWAWLTNTSWTYNDDAFIQAAATERRAAFTALGVTLESDYEGTIDILKMIISNYETGLYGDVTNYMYNVSWSSDFQRLLVPVYSFTEDTANYDVYVKLSKTLKGTDGYYSGATFGVYRDSACTTKITDIVTGGAQWSISDKIQITSQTATLYIKEISSGQDGVPVDPTVYSVAVNASANSSAATAATVFGSGRSGEIVNYPGTNHKEPEGVITKVDAITGQGIGPACFELEGTAVGGTYIKKSVWTDENGSIDLQWWDKTSTENYIQPGAFMVTEVQPPPGHTLTTDGAQYLRLWLEWIDDDSYAEGGYYEAYNSGPITFRNLPTKTATLQKLSGSGTALEGAVFNIYKDGALIGTQTTNAAGKIMLTDLESGYFEFEETQSPAGHVLPEKNRVGVYVNSSDTSISNYVLTMVNHEYPDIVIQKDSASSGRGLANAVFKVSIDGRTLGTFKTDSTGKIIISYDVYGEFLTPGNNTWSVLIEETEAPSGHLVADLNWQQNTIIKGQKLSTFTFVNQEYPKIVIEKRCSITNEPLMGAAYDVFLDGARLGSFITEADGTITIAYEYYKSFINEDNSTWAVRVVETKAPDKYFLAEDTHQENQLIRGQEKTTFVYTNQPLPDVVVHKTDSKSGEPLEGVTFTLEGVNSSASYLAISDEKGLATFESVPAGTYTLSETAVAGNYQLSDKTYTVEVEPGCDQVFDYYYANDRLPTLTLHKACSITGDPLENVGFSLEYKDSSGGIHSLGTHYTDINGEIVLEGLDAVWLKATEVAPKSGYAIREGEESQELYLTPNADHHLYFENVPLSAIVIRKIDTEAVSTPLAGAVFELRYLGGDTSGSGGTTIGRYTTSANGTCVITGLERGYYILEEVIPPPNHSLSGETIQTVFISGNDQDIITVTFRNQRNPDFLLIKRDASDRATPLPGAVYKITDSGGGVIGDNNGLFETSADGTIAISNLTPGMTLLVQEVQAPAGFLLDNKVYTAKLDGSGAYELILYNEPLREFVLTKLDGSDKKTPLPGVEYYITFADGSFVPGGANGYFTTDAAGKITLTGLTIGDVIKIQETKTKDGSYILDGTIYTHTIEAGSNSKTLYNERATRILLFKYDSVTGKGVPSVKFLLMDRNKNPLMVIETDQDGYAYIDASEELAEGKYFLKELEAEGYIVDEQIKTVYLEAGKTKRIEWANTPELGQIQVRKVSGDYNEYNATGAGTALSGAVFGIYNYRSGALVGKMASGSDGWAVSDPLPLGQYVVKELQAPSFYKLSDEEIIVTVEYPNQILKYEFVNYSANVGVSINKTGVKEAVVGSDIVYTFHNIQNKSTTSLSDFFWRDVLPVDSVRLNYITTGTYSHSLKYDVVVTTSFGRTMTIAGNLSTTQNNYIDCSAPAIGLSTGEYVTSFTLVFGTVPSGFAQVTAPQCSVKVQQGLTNGAMFVNKADVGGKSGNEWIIINTTWSTKVYNPHSPVTPTLPKTGY